METPSPPAVETPRPRPSRKAERALEWMLWQTRWMIIVPVFALLVSAASLVVSTVHHVYEALHAADTTEALVLHVEAMDASLLAAALVIFALGLYELFISKIDTRLSYDTGGILRIENLDDLKSKLGKIIVILLGVKFFKVVQGLHPQSPLDLLYFASGVVGVAAAFYLVKSRHE